MNGPMYWGEDIDHKKCLICNLNDSLFMIVII